MSTQELAGQVRESFTQATRADGSTYWTHDARADSLAERVLIAARNGGTVPGSNHLTAAVVAALDFVAEEGVRDAVEAGWAFASRHAATDRADLLRWLAELPNGLEVVDEVWAFGGTDKGTEYRIHIGQHAWLASILEAVVSVLADEPASV